MSQPVEFFAPKFSRRQLLMGLGASVGLAVAGPTARAFALSEIVIDAPIDGRDATDIIMNQIAAAPDGSVIRFPVGRSQGKYRVDGRLWIQERRNLTIVGPSAGDPATIWSDKVGQDLGIVNQNGYSKRNHWSFRKCSGMTIQNLRIEGPNRVRDAAGYSKLTTIYEGEHGFSFNMSSDCKLIDCSTDSVYGDGCWIHAPSGYKTSNVAVERFTTTSNGRHGMGVFNVDGVVVDGLRVVKGGTCGVDMEPNGPGESTLNVEIRNSTIDTRTVAFAAMGAREVSNVWLHHNTVTRAKTWPMLGVKRRDGGRSRNWRVEDNRQLFKISPAQGFAFTRVDNAVVRRNHVELGARDTIVGTRFTECAGALEVTDNNFTGAGAAYAKDTLTGPVVSRGNLYRGA